MNTITDHTLVQDISLLSQKLINNYPSQHHVNISKTFGQNSLTQNTIKLLQLFRFNA